MAKKKPLGLVEAVGADRRQALEALRALLAERIVQAEPKETAPLVNQLRRVLAELADLPEQKARSVVDDLASRRANRRSAAAGS